VARFIGAYTNRIDKKGRISVPSDFRMAVADQGFEGVAVFPSFTHAALEGGGMDVLDEAEALIDELDPYGDERYAFAITMLAEARKLSFDGEGRILLPQDFLDHAELTERAVFAGLGQRFQIWEPEAFEAARAEARRIARDNRGLLSGRGRRPAANQPGGPA
jgi:MraZ protein